MWSSDGRQRSPSSIDGQSFEVGCDIPSAPGDVSGLPSVQYWRPMCVALKYDTYSLSHDYAATATTTAPTDVTAVEDDVAATPTLFSAVDRRNYFRQASRATQLPAARLCRPQAMTPSAHARCDEHLYEPTSTHDTVTSSRDQRTFNDFADS